MAKFKTGQSGNPKGRPRGQTNAAKFRKDLDRHVPEILEKLVTLAKEGDPAAIKILLDRTLPTLKPQDMPVLIAGLKGTLTAQGQTIIKNMSSGKLMPAETSSMLAAMTNLAKITEIDDLTKRIEALENEHH